MEKIYSRYNAIQRELVKKYIVEKGITMSENVLSAFKNELGYINATNQYVELSVRITEKDHGSDLKNDLQRLAQSVNLNVSTLVEDYMCRISKSYIVNVNSCLENFLKSFRHLPGSPTNITEIEKKKKTIGWNGR